jgi:hypothetical protein
LSLTQRNRFLVLNKMIIENVERKQLNEIKLINSDFPIYFIIFRLYTTTNVFLTDNSEI